MFRPYCCNRKIICFIKALAVLLLLLCTSVHAAKQKITLTLQDIEIAEVMNMLSQQQQVNIVLTEGVQGKVSVNLYNMELLDVIHAISQAAGYEVEKHRNTYFIVKHEDVGRYGDSGLTEIRSFKVQYTDPAEVETILKKHLSNYGKITLLSKRKILVVEDLPPFLKKIEKLLAAIDIEPRQILIEAKILEVTLTDDESFGVDWTYFFDIQDGIGRLGTQQLASLTKPGLFLDFLGPNMKVALDALKQRGRLRTLSTPTLLAMEDQTAETQVGTRLGYSVTTTINQVTSESIEFLETGIILKVTPTVDQQGMIMLDIHPEVSEGTVSDDGIPSKSTTQISTQMLVSDGQTVFLGGLIRRNITESTEGVPILGDMPIIGAAFSNKSDRLAATEIVVLITPTIVNFSGNKTNARAIGLIDRHEKILIREEQQVEAEIIEYIDGKKTINKEQPADKKAEEKSENKKTVNEVSSGGTGVWILDQ